MKATKIQLDIDYIGGVRSLTKEDEQAISDFIKQRKLSSKKASSIIQSKKTKLPKTKV